MNLPGPRPTAALSFLVSAAVGVVTNLITDRFTWALAASLAVLIAVGAPLAMHAASSGGTSRTRLRQKAARGGALRGNAIKLRGGADVTDTATGGGRIERSGVTADGGHVQRRANKNGEITDSPVDIN